MFDELDKSKNKGHFFFQKGGVLKEMSKDVPNLPGIYYIYRQCKGEINLVYIGKSGAMLSDGNFKKQGLRDRLNKKQDKHTYRQEYFELKLAENESDALDIYWHVTFDSDFCFEEQTTKKLDIKAEDLPPIRRLFVDSVNNAIIAQEESTVIPLSTADERGNCFYEYDLELPDELRVLETVIGNDEIEVFNFNNDTFGEIDALVIVLADDINKVSLYKKLSSVEVLGRGGYMLWKSNQRLERFEEQLLRISSSFQVLRVEESVIILNLKTIEKSFGFHDVIKREATIGLEAINDMGIVSNIDTLGELIENVSFARKLTKIARNSPVIQRGIPNVSIIAFSRTHPAIRNKMRYTPDGSQFALDTKVSKDLFIKLLNDDFLTSELTQLYYDSLAKDNIETENEQIENEANE